MIQFSAKLLFMQLLGNTQAKFTSVKRSRLKNTFVIFVAKLLSLPFFWRNAQHKNSNW